MQPAELLKRTVDDLICVLQDQDRLGWSDVDFRNPLREVFLPQSMTKQKSQTAQSNEDKTISTTAATVAHQVAFSKKELPDNVACTLCADRLYAVRRYLIEGSLPILVLRYSYPINEKSKPLPDRTDRSYFATAEEEDLFRRMAASVSINMNQLFFQEFPACHFDPRSLEEDWNRRTTNCLVHLRNTVSRHNIKFLIVTGASAILLFGSRAKQLAEASTVFEFPLTEKLSLPCLVLRSPAALIAMEKQRQKAEAMLTDFADASKFYQGYKSKPVEFRSLMNEKLRQIEDGQTAAGGTQTSSEKMIAGVRLKTASSITASPTEEDKFKSANRNDDAILWKLMTLREEEVKVKKQIVSSLQAMKGKLKL